MTKRPTRAEVPALQTWDLSDLFPSTTAWDTALSAVGAAIPGVSQYQGRLGESAATLQACLDAQESLLVSLTRVTAYASLRNSEDGTNPLNQAAMGRIASLTAQVSAALSFVRAEILALPPATLQQFQAAAPGLANYAKYLADLEAARAHTLSPETEQALAALGEVLSAPAMIYNRSKSSDITFPAITDSEGNEVPISFAAYEVGYQVSPDTEMRRKAFAAFGAGLKRYENTWAATFATEVKKNVALAKLRGFGSAEEMILHGQQVSMAMYTNILDVIQAELAPHMQRLARLRKRLLGLDKLLYCDLQTPMEPAFDPAISYAEASQLMVDSLAIMGDEYLGIMKDALTKRWIDLPDNVGKSTGAFCNSVYGVHPYILITWKDNARNAFTLAHELGHAGHFGLAMRYQRFTNLRPALYCVEAPSTMNEMLLAQHLTAKHQGDARMRRWVILSQLATYHHNYITHLLEAELQRRIYALAESGKAITATTLSTVKGEILQRFWGDTVEIDDAARLTWMRQPHYYSGLYPYTYAAGLTVSTAAAQNILREGQPAVDRWLEMLKAGGTLRPLELFRLGGVDMGSAEPVRQAVAYVGALVDELEQLAGAR